MRALRVVWAYLRTGLLGEFAYRGNLLAQVVQSLLGLGYALGAVAVIFAHTGTLGGWRPEEVIALVGVFFVIRGAIRAVVQPSMALLMEDIRRGTLDFMLIKPADAQLLVSVRQVQVWRLVDLALGVAVLASAVARLGASVGAAASLAFAAAVLCGAAIVYSVLLVLATISFWFVRVENILVIFQTLYETGRWPIGIYPRWLQWGLTFLVPVAFAVTVPAEGLTGRLSPATLAGAAALAGALLLASRWFWRVGLRHYTGASA